jgi:hypothetical protein
VGWQFLWGLLVHDLGLGRVDGATVFLDGPRKDFPRSENGGTNVLGVVVGFHNSEVERVITPGVLILVSSLPAINVPILLRGGLSLSTRAIRGAAFILALLLGREVVDHVPCGPEIPH